MARTKKRKPGNGNIAEFPPPAGAEPSDANVEGEPPAAQPPQERQEAPEPPRTGGRPDPLPKIRSFFQTLSSIPVEDWGTRVKVRVYRLKPVYDMLIGSNKKYIKIYDQPPVDEEIIKRDCGSGRYRLYLNVKEPTERKDKEMQSVEIDILDPRFPPELPYGAWLDESVNREWKWAGPMLKARQTAAERAENPGAMGANMTDALNVLSDIQDRAVEKERSRNQQQPQQAAFDPASTLQVVANVAKEMAQALKTTPENPMAGFMTEQMAAMRAEIAESRRRNDQLMDRLMERANAPQQPSGMGAIKELIGGIKELLPEIKGIFPQADEAIAERVTRSKMSGLMEFFQPVLPKLMDVLTPFAPIIAQRVMQGSSSTPTPPGMPPPRPPMPAGLNPAPAQSPQQPNLDRMLLNALTNDRDGGEFADSLLMLFGDEGNLMYRQACSLGEEGLLKLIQTRPVWEQLGTLRAKVPQFVHEFIEYGQEPSEQPAEGTEPAATDAEVVDLTGASE